jgi:hypothetical protein
MNAPFSTMGAPQPQVVVFTPAMRMLIADAIESLILLLDEIDGDSDHKEDADFEGEPDIEPSLGATAEIDQSIAWLASTSEIDAEAEHDVCEPDADLEPRFVQVFEAR